MTQTPFEQTGVVTPFATGAAFLQGLATASGGRMAMDQVGTSVQGQPIWLVRLGATTAPTYTPSPSSALWVALQHGNEPQSWQTLIQWIRDLVETPTPGDLAYLANHPMFLMPCTNPDNAGTQDPMNSDGYNINRDHLTFRTPEAKAIQQVLTAIRPQLVLDMHTGGTLDMELQSADATETDPAIVALSAQARDHLIDYLNGEGITSGPYPTSMAEPRMLWTAAGLRNTCALLAEVRSSTGNPATDPTLGGQIGWYLATVRELAKWHATHTESLASAQSVARLRAAGRGERAQPFAMGTTGPDIPAAPSGYSLTPEQAADAAGVLSALDVTIADGRVAMSQPARNLIPYVLDKRAISATVAAEQMPPLIPAEASPTGQRAVRLDGRTHPVSHVRYRIDGQDAAVT